MVTGRDRRFPVDIGAVANADFVGLVKEKRGDAIFGNVQDLAAHGCAALGLDLDLIAKPCMGADARNADISGADIADAAPDADEFVWLCAG